MIVKSKSNVKLKQDVTKEVLGSSATSQVRHSATSKVKPAKKISSPATNAIPVNCMSTSTAIPESRVIPPKGKMKTSNTVVLDEELFRVMLKKYQRGGLDDIGVLLAYSNDEVRRIAAEEIGFTGDLALYFLDLDEAEFFRQWEKEGYS